MTRCSTPPRSGGSHDRKRLEEHGLITAFFDPTVRRALRAGLASPDHLFVDGSLTKAHASINSFKLQTLGADKGYDQGPLLVELERSRVTPHVVVKAGPIGGRPGTRHRRQNQGDIDARRRMRRRTRSRGYAISQRCRKKIEKAFGWMKTVGGLARTRLIGHVKTNQQAHLAAAAFNLVRMRSLAT